MAKIFELHMKKAGITDLKIKRDDGRITKNKLIKSDDLKNLTEEQQCNVLMYLKSPYRKLLRTQNGVYIIGNPIGFGAFGRVYKGIRVTDGASVAIKYVRKYEDTEMVWTTMSGFKVPMELKLLTQVQDVEGVIKLHDFVELEDYFVYVMERPRSCKELYKHIEENEKMDENTARIFFRQIVETVIACHKKGVFHRDIKSDNILIDTNTNKLRLIDFGCGAEIQSNSEIFSEFQGLYAPPEFASGSYQGGPATVWTLGMLLFEMVFGRIPQDLSADQPSYQQTLSSLSLEVMDLIMRCLNTVFPNRIKIEDILQHPWMTCMETNQLNCPNLADWSP